MVRWHHWFNGLEFEQTLGDGEGQGRLACCSQWVTKSWTWPSGWTRTTTTRMRMKCNLHRALINLTPPQNHLQTGSLLCLHILIARFAFASNKSLSLRLQIMLQSANQFYTDIPFWVHEFLTLYYWDAPKWSRKDILNFCSVLFLTPEVLSTLNCLLHSHFSCWNCFNRAQTCTLGLQLHKDQAFSSPHFSKLLRMGNYVFLKNFKGLLWWLSGKESSCNAGHRFDPWSRKILRAMEQRSPCAATMQPVLRACELRLLSPHVVTSEDGAP